MALISWEVWSIFCVLVTLAALADLGLVVKSDSTVVSPKVAAWMTGLWVALALAFAAVIGFHSNWHDATLFMTGYLVELSLSVDNIFVFILIFGSFKISQKDQHKVLFVGVVSAILMRFLMISGGIYLVQKFQWIFYIFGAFLIYSGIKIIQELRHAEQKPENQDSKILTLLKKYLPIYDGEVQNKFFIKIDGKRYVTHLLLVLLLIEQVDLVFALDSIPAILAITDDILIVFTSNIFAILGLRSMYFFLSDILDKFSYIKHALAFILSFIGVKMIVAVQGIHIDIRISLAVIASSILIAITVSLYKKKHETFE